MPDEPLTDADLDAVKVLIAHQRLDIGSCLCGWGVDTGDLGRLHSLHVWRELQRAVLPAHDARVRAQAGEDIAAFFDAWAMATGRLRRSERAVVLSEIARIARQVSGQVDAPNSTPDGPDQLRTEVVRRPCPEGFHWIGQALTACDQCGLPAWEHDGMAKLPAPLPSLASGEPRWVLDPWKPGEREACRRKWDPGYAAREEATGG